MRTDKGCLMLPITTITPNQLKAALDWFQKQYPQNWPALTLPLPQPIEVNPLEQARLARLAHFESAKKQEETPAQQTLPVALPALIDYANHHPKISNCYELVIQTLYHAKPRDLGACLETLFRHWFNTESKGAMEYYETHYKDLNGLSFTIGKHLLKGVLGTVTQQLSEENSNALSLLPLFEYYFDQPLFFAALLVWALQRGITAQRLVNHTLLHKFAAANAFNMNESDNPVPCVYALLEQFEEGIELAKLAPTAPCRGDKYPSYVSLACSTLPRKKLCFLSDEQSIDKDALDENTLYLHLTKENTLRYRAKHVEEDTLSEKAFHKEAFEAIKQAVQSAANQANLSVVELTFSEEQQTYRDAAIAYITTKIRLPIEPSVVFIPTIQNTSKLFGLFKLSFLNAALRNLLDLKQKNKPELRAVLSNLLNQSEGRDFLQFPELGGIHATLFEPLASLLSEETTEFLLQRTTFAIYLIPYRPELVHHVTPEFLTQWIANVQEKSKGELDQLPQFLSLYTTLLHHPDAGHKNIDDLFEKIMHLAFIYHQWVLNDEEVQNCLVASPRSLSFFLTMWDTCNDALNQAILSQDNLPFTAEN
ncbi:MAG: hypothetical protein WC785_06420, partial [Tatlockia sp.]